MAEAVQEGTIILAGDDGKVGARLRVWLVRDSKPVTGAPPGLRLDEAGRLILVEGLTYGYELLGADDSVFSSAKLEPCELFEPDRAGASRGRLTPGNRAGILAITLSGPGEFFVSATAEVASSKLRYEVEYRSMLRDITSDLAEAALARFGATQSHYALMDEGEPSTLYQRFAFLQALLDTEEYQQALNQVLARPYVSSVRKLTIVPTSRGLRASSSTIRALTQSGPRRALPKSIGVLTAVPREIQDSHLAPDTDNVPNRFIKALLESWRGLAQAVQSALVSERAMTNRAPAPVIRGLAESTRIIDGLDVVLASPLFRTVSRLQNLPVANEVLLKRPGYRELARLHQQAQLAATMTWDGADLVFGAGQRDVATLYEYWAFLHIGRIVADLCGKSFDYAGLFEVSDSGLQLNLRKRRAQVVQGMVAFADHELHLSLWFNRPFRRSSGESWTRDMRPDMSLSIATSKDAGALESIWLHFDAKYRVDRLLGVLNDEEDEDLGEGGKGDRSLRADLLKMHAYRDAIRRSSGAYVIYPGDGSGKNDETFLQYHEILPGLGAFALLPSENGPLIGASAIRSFLVDVLSHAGDVLSHSHRADYWVNHVRGQPPTPSKSSAVPSRTVEGLRLLNRPPDDEMVCFVRMESFVHWGQADSILHFRGDGPPELLAHIFRSQWAVLISDAGQLILLRLGATVSDVTREPVEAMQGTWLGMLAAPSTAPDWLTSSAAQEVLAAHTSTAMSWGDLARRICS